MIHTRPTLAIAAALLAAVTARAAPATDMTEFYSGKAVTFLVGTEEGVYARAIGRHMMRYIPGTPTVRFEEISGNAGRRAAARLAALAPGDGLTVAAIPPQAIVEPLFSPPPGRPEYDAAKFEYIGSASSATHVCIVDREAPATGFDQALVRPLLIGARRSGGPTLSESLMLKNLVGANFQLVPRYTDRGQIMRAVEHGEIHGVCGYDWAELKREQAEPLAEKRIHVLLQFSLDGHRELDQLGVPQLWTYVKDPRDRAAFELVATAMVFARPFVAPPGTPRPQVNALRVAFERTMRDLDFRADARIGKLDISPTTGEVVQHLVEKMFKAPDDVIRRVHEARRVPPAGGS